ncbi:fibronectin type III domain-containing protein [Agromyces sp. LHK192]|uniref:fibronectin type III domain-containing protein n=1 Tax=Agromyces sp. LHK192 TaxID=2498704 RepID=UPI0013E380A0|nr:fibronectin type III domain-containing protein [Agromyces sp. LHK192]
MSATAPVALAAPKVTAKGSTLTVAWTAGADGGSPVTGYKLVLNGGTPIPVAATATTHTFPKLGAGTYRVSVIATNAIGDSTASPASAKVTLTGATAATTPSETSVDTTAAASDGGAPSWLAGTGILLAIVAIGALALLGQRVLKRRATPAAAGATAEAATTSVPDAAASAEASDGARSSDR